MFPLTRPVRQTLATLLLLGLTVVPTGLIGAFAWRINRPGHVRDVEIELGRQLGLQVTLEGVRYPKAGEVAYQGIVLRRKNRAARGSLNSLARFGPAATRYRELIVHLENPRLHCESPRNGLRRSAAFCSASARFPSSGST